MNDTSTTIDPIHDVETEPIDPSINTDTFYDESAEVDATENKSESETAAALREAKEHAKQKGSELLDKARESAKNRADHYVNESSSSARSIERATRGAADQVREEEPEFVSAAFDWLADRGADVARYLEEKDSKQIGDDIRRTIREHPGLTLGGLAAAGFLAGRFLKAEQPESSSDAA